MAKIVWIDDETDVIDGVVAPLEAAGHDFVRIRTASDAILDENIEIIRKSDLILLDLILPSDKRDVIAGFDLLRTLRMDHNIQTPTVVFSVMLDGDLQRRLEELRISGFIAKPVRPSVLRDKIEAILARQRESQ